MPLTSAWPYRPRRRHVRLTGGVLYVYKHSKAARAQPTGHAIHLNPIRYRHDRPCGWSNIAQNFSRGAPTFFFSPPPGTPCRPLGDPTASGEFVPARESRTDGLGVPVRIPGVGKGLTLRLFKRSHRVASWCQEGETQGLR